MPPVRRQPGQSFRQTSSRKPAVRSLRSNVEALAGDSDYFANSSEIEEHSGRVQEGLSHQVNFGRRNPRTRLTANDLTLIDPLLHPPPSSSPPPLVDDAPFTPNSDGHSIDTSASCFRNRRVIPGEPRWKSAPRKGRTGKAQCTAWPENNESMLDNLIGKVWDDSARGLANDGDDWPQGVARQCPPSEARKLFDSISNFRGHAMTKARYIAQNYCNAESYSDRNEFCRHIQQLVSNDRWACAKEETFGGRFCAKIIIRAIYQVFYDNGHYSFGLNSNTIWCFDQYQPAMIIWVCTLLHHGITEFELGIKTPRKFEGQFAERIYRRMEKTWHEQSEARQQVILQHLRTEVLKSVRRDQTSEVEAAINPFADSMEDLIELGFTAGIDGSVVEARARESRSPSPRGIMNIETAESAALPCHVTVEVRTTELAATLQSGAQDDDDVMNRPQDDVETQSNTEAEMVRGARRDHMRLRSKPDLRKQFDDLRSVEYELVWPGATEPETEVMKLSSKLSCGEFFNEIGMDGGQSVWYRCPLEVGKRKHRLEEDEASYLLYLKKVLKYRLTVELFHTGPNNEAEGNSLGR